MSVAGFGEVVFTPDLSWSWRASSGMHCDALFWGAVPGIAERDGRGILTGWAEADMRPAHKAGCVGAVAGGRLTVSMRILVVDCGSCWCVVLGDMLSMVNRTRRRLYMEMGRVQFEDSTIFSVTNSQDRKTALVPLLCCCRSTKRP